MRLAAAALLVCSAATAEEPARLSFDGISEQRFNPLNGAFTARLRGAAIAADDDSVQIFINDAAVDKERIRVSDRSISVEFEFTNGVNDLVVLAQGEDGSTIRGDALLWAGENTLVVDVVYADMTPVSTGQVRVELASNTAVSERRETHGGTARFDNLPNAPVRVRASAPQAKSAAVASNGGAGSILITLETDE